MTRKSYERAIRALRLVLKLGRLKMTVFSAVTYAAAANLAVGLPPNEFDAWIFLSGWLFVLFTQLVAHFLGEYYDLASDKLNCYAGPLTGGSKVLLSGDVTPRQCFLLGYACMAAAVTILVRALPERSWPIGVALVFIAHQYSAPPFKFNHRGLGELVASVASNVLLPQFAVLVQSASFETVWLVHSSLAVLVLPAFFLKVGLFLALNMADRRADWLGGKYTLPVLLGDETCARLLGACNVLAYLSAICIFFMGLCTPTTLVAILLSAPEGLSIARSFNPSLKTMAASGSGKAAPDGNDEQQRLPYRLEGLVVRILGHAPCVVLAVFADAALVEVIAAGAAATAKAVEGGHAGCCFWSTVMDWLSDVAGALVSTSLPVRCLPLVPFVYMFLVQRPPPPPPPPSSSVKDTSSGAAEATTPSVPATVVVAGGGVGGLVLGACLQQLGLPYEILEKGLSSEDDSGADIALWPAAAKILKELGVGSSKTADDDGFVDVSDFWGQNTYPVQLVRICKVDKLSQEQHHQARASSSKSTAVPEGVEGKVQAGSVFANPPDKVLTKVDMDAVVEGTGEPFRLVRRRAIMSSMLPLLELGRIRRGARVVRAEQSSPPRTPTATACVVSTPVAREAASDASAGGEQQTIVCRVLVGADGINSVCRREVVAVASALAAGTGGDGATSLSYSGGSPVAAAGASGPRDGGEVCYRGVLDFKAGSAAARLRALFEEDEERYPNSMSVVYGDRIRFSWGFLDGARQTGYWFVKQLTEKGRGKGGSGDAEETGQNDRLGEEWPEPLRTFARMTNKECSYAHRIQDRPPLERWSCGNITLLGDACHPATPNNGQGACMAIEDALVLATLLAEFWDKPDGHVEAFYLYERARLAHTRGVQRESLKQMKLGQLTSRAGIWVRELVIGILPPSVLQKKLRAANVFEIEPWLQRFRVLKAKRAESPS